MMVDLHGGAWCNGNRTNDVVMNEALAKSGVLVAALDFRLPPDAGYPASVADIHYGIRWLKARARELKGRADRVGAIGISSGGHQAMLVAMRPTDGRYAAQALPAGSPAVDARLRCVVLCWPVIDPLGRYHYAKKLKAAAGVAKADEIVTLASKDGLAARMGTTIEIDGKLAETEVRVHYKVTKEGEVVIEGMTIGAKATIGATSTTTKYFAHSDMPTARPSSSQSLMRRSRKPRCSANPASAQNGSWTTS